MPRSERENPGKNVTEPTRRGKAVLGAAADLGARIHQLLTDIRGDGSTLCPGVWGTQTSPARRCRQLLHPIRCDLQPIPLRKSRGEPFAPCPKLHRHQLRQRATQMFWRFVAPSATTTPRPSSPPARRCLPDPTRAATPLRTTRLEHGCRRSNPAVMHDGGTSRQQFPKWCIRHVTHRRRKLFRNRLAKLCQQQTSRAHQLTRIARRSEKFLRMSHPRPQRKRDRRRSLITESSHLLRQRLARPIKPSKPGQPNLPGQSGCGGAYHAGKQSDHALRRKPPSKEPLHSRQSKLSTHRIQPRPRDERKPRRIHAHQ